MSSLREFHNLEKRPKLIGLTGNIGSGKSTAARFIEELGIPCISSDQIVHDLYAQNEELKNFLIENFSSLDKKVIAQNIFGEEEEKKTKRKLLELKVHPLVEEKLQQWIVSHSNYPILVNDVPLLFEAHLESRFDSIIFIQVDEAIQLKRLRKRNPLMSETEIIARIKSQMPQEIKIAKANFIIPNNGSLQDFQVQIQETLEKLILSFKIDSRTS